ncbi:MAG: bifunctional methylenetetrahydrofolate dehydrogenase/methenyltetrahydrofolate cyclohydrolase FolD [Humidesulfovibrio sp.]|uniref:bifunctional methylenetetrahydrofolate dehydrogenase/methenyltetrahydrofolate cyclohydrolase FolD n=1 Tax=Humidesulfovibrio sp. TaxID=2910988 RepID=UPI0027E77AB1|nr:bifunctional methylenetetrahydrofolate dehydrogenase/methenyltetrahydrofolate cyclohydrolase FolD [Humidesulfovibrio sp.]MDQ7833842.1 bifunctional methylenetetrahydrofolate dehydrogenase/methenyltetrahydrofolate cyclohydrolase FolD [Humidesulfovibrio sp.]
MILLDGKATAQSIRSELKVEVAEITAAQGRAPGLAVILVGQDPASQVYVRNKERACAEVGIASFPHVLPASTTQAELEALIASLNADVLVDGILLQLPVPGGLDSRALLERIAPDKDVDGFHPQNMGRLAQGLPGFAPCTPAGVIELLRRYDLPTQGKHAVVVGRSNIVGRPLSIMLSQPGRFGDATVTLCHSRTPDLTEQCKRADFVFAAIGKPKFVTCDMVKPGAVVVDVGINRVEEGLVGDCDFEYLCATASAMTPVPGGIGPMTIAMLLKNTVQAFKEHTAA